MELTERHISQLLDAVKSSTDAAAATTTTNRVVMEELNKLSAEVSSLKMQVALSRQEQKNTAEQVKELHRKLFGDKDDGIIQRQNDRIEEIRLELAEDIADNKRNSKKADGILSVINGIFSMITSFAMSKYGGR